MIPVNKPFLPNLNQYNKYSSIAFKNRWLTNDGPLVNELKDRLEDFLQIKNLLLVSNGTIALQVAFKALDVENTAITTPFTFVATSSSLSWEKIKPLYVDIDPQSYNLCPLNVKQHLMKSVSAIVPVHVYGNPCALEAFEELRNNELKVIYDAAHAFGVQGKNKNIFTFGDASTLSFHATKIFHSGEGGAVIFKSSDIYERAKKIINFGIDTATGNIIECGINAKMSELHAAMGLAVLDDWDKIIKKRLDLFELYTHCLRDYVQFPKWNPEFSINASYFPVTFISNDVCNEMFNHLLLNGVMTRKYFSPSLDKVVVFDSVLPEQCPYSNHISQTTLCLPLYYDLEMNEVKYICKLIIEFLRLR